MLGKRQEKPVVPRAIERGYVRNPCVGLRICHHLDAKLAYAAFRVISM
jgi:hypothetical protein